MTDAARLADLRSAIHELYQARFERAYRVMALHDDREDDDVLASLFDADPRMRALTLAITTLRDQAAEMQDLIDAQHAVEAAVARRSLGPLAAHVLREVQP